MGTIQGVVLQGLATRSPRRPLRWTCTGSSMQCMGSSISKLRARPASDWRGAGLGMHEPYSQQQQQQAATHRHSRALSVLRSASARLLRVNAWLRSASVTETQRQYTALAATAFWTSDDLMADNDTEWPQHLDRLITGLIAEEEKARRKLERDKEREAAARLREVQKREREIEREAAACIERLVRKLEREHASVQQDDGKPYTETRRNGHVFKMAGMLCDDFLTARRHQAHETRALSPPYGRRVLRSRHTRSTRGRWLSVPLKSRWCCRNSSGRLRHT